MSPVVRDCIERCGRYAAAGQSTCTPCQQARWRRKNETRDPLTAAVYQSAGYRRARADVLAGATRCATCGGHVSVVGKLTAGHVLSIRQAPELATSAANLAPQCRSCQELEKSKRRAASAERLRAGKFGRST
jgi:5-methylcytosine-specific restriction endonuclease McrA